MVETFLLQIQSTTVADLLALLLLSVAAYTDLRWRRIFNWTTYPILCWAAALALLITVCQPFAVSAPPIGNLTLSGFLIGAVGCGLVMLIPYQLSGGGAGDVKLAMALGGLIGFTPAIWALAVGYLLAASWAIFKACWELTSWSLISGLLRQIGHRFISAEICPPTPQQQMILAQPMPLAGFFGLGALFSRMGGVPW